MASTAFRTDSNDVFSGLVDQMFGQGSGLGIPAVPGGMDMFSGSDKKTNNPASPFLKNTKKTTDVPGALTNSIANEGQLIPFTPFVVGGKDDELDSRLARYAKSLLAGNSGGTSEVPAVTSGGSLSAGDRVDVGGGPVGRGGGVGSITNAENLIGSTPGGGLGISDIYPSTLAGASYAIGSDGKFVDPMAGYRAGDVTNTANISGATTFGHITDSIDRAASGFWGDVKSIGNTPDISTGNVVQAGVNLAGAVSPLMAILAGIGQGFNLWSAPDSTGNALADQIFTPGTIQSTTANIFNWIDRHIFGGEYMPGDYVDPAIVGPNPDGSVKRPAATFEDIFGKDATGTLNTSSDGPNYAYNSSFGSQSVDIGGAGVFNAIGMNPWQTTDGGGAFGFGTNKPTSGDGSSSNPYGAFDNPFAGALDTGGGTDWGAGSRLNGSGGGGGYNGMGWGLGPDSGRTDKIGTSTSE